MPDFASAPRSLPTAAALLATGVLCAAAAARQDVTPTVLRPLESPVYAMPGGTLMVPLAGGPGERPAFDGAIRVGSAPDRPLPSLLNWIDHDPPRAAEPMERWLGTGGDWSAQPAPEPGDDSGFWALAVEIPPAATAGALLVGTQTIPLRWIAPPDPEPPDVPPSPDANADSLARLLARAPAERWRARLLDPSLDVPPFGDELIEAIAVQAERRWSAALGRVRRVDPGVAAALRAALTRRADLPGKPGAPAWAPPGPRLSALRDEVLDAASDTDALAVARAWLDQQPGAGAWVASLAGGADGAVGSVGAVSLGARPVAVSIGAEGRPAPELARLEPGAADEFPVSLRAPRADARAVRVDVRVGAFARELTMPTLPVPVGAGGIPVTPLLAEWTLASWHAALDGTGAPAPWTDTSALLYRDVTRPDPLPVVPGTPVVPRDGWVVFVECLGSAPAGRVTARFGAAGVRSVAIAPQGTEGDGVRTVQAGDRWCAWLAVPPGAIGPDGVLRLAVERTGADGSRWQWPCPSFPWQEAGGGAALDLSSGAAR